MFNYEFQAIKPVGILHPVQLHAALPNSYLSGHLWSGSSAVNIPPLMYKILLSPKPIVSINMPCVFTYRRTSSPRGTRCCPASHCPGVILGVTENCRRWETLPWPRVTAATMSRAIDGAAAEEWSPPRQHRRRRKARSWARRWR